MPYQHPEFTQCPPIHQGSEAFKQLMQDFPPEQILWPKNTELAKEIWTIIHKATINEIYPAFILLAKKTADLRPHLLYLLYGFKDNEQMVQLDIDRFLTLHWLAQLMASGYKNIQAIPAVQGLDLLRLSTDEKRAFISAQIDQKPSVGETALFKIEEDEMTVIAVIIKLLVSIEFSWKNAKNEQAKNKIKTYNNNKRLIEQFIEKNPRFIQFKEVTSSNIAAFRHTLETVYQSSALNSKLQTRIIYPVFFNGQSPLLTYHLVDNKWFFLILAPSALRNYLEISSGQKLPISMHWRYQPITPVQMKKAKMKFQRLGTLSHFGQDKFSTVHDIKVLNSVDETLHDLYHFYVNAYILLALHHIINHCIQLLEQETHYFLSRISWNLVDSEFNYCLNQKQSLTNQFTRMFSSVFDENMQQSHEWSIIMTDLFVNKQKDVWKNIDDSSIISNKNPYINIYQATQSLATTAMYLFLSHNNLSFIPQGKLSWKRDHHLHRNDISIYLNDAPVRQVIFLYQLTAKAQIGTFRKVTPVAGGRIHHVWQLTTTLGEFAVKILNKTRVSSADLNRYRQTEKIAKHFGNNLAISALPINNDVIFTYEKNYCMVYPWAEGKTPNNNRDYAQKVGKALAQIHNKPMVYDKDIPSHSTYVNQQAQKLEWSFPNIKGDLTKMLAENLALIADIQNQAAVIRQKPLSDEKDCVVSHRDLDASNVIMKGDQILLIDWELAGYIEPCTDFLLTALYTARTAPGVFNLDLFKEFIAGYTLIKPIPNPAAWENAWVRILDGWLQWLHFNLQRARDEKSIGYIEAVKILKTIATVYEKKNQWDLTQYVQAPSKAPEWSGSSSSSSVNNTQSAVKTSVVKMEKK